jgi:ElaB/YqjD/DUF883 family membrane-anchored ribosome-binding protein
MAKENLRLISFERRKVMEGQYQLQEEERPGEREEREREKRRREEWERRTGLSLQATAQEYGEKIAQAASTAKDYVSDKMSVVGDKMKELQNSEFGEISANAKEYARQNPGQAILISAATGFILGFLIRGSRR